MLSHAEMSCGVACKLHTNMCMFSEACRLCKAQQCECICYQLARLLLSQANVGTYAFVINVSILRSGLI